MLKLKMCKNNKLEKIMCKNSEAPGQEKGSNLKIRDFGGRHF